MLVERKNGLVILEGGLVVRACPHHNPQNLLMEGAPLRQTVTVRDMFRVAFEAAVKTESRRAEMSGEGMLGM